jgi:hypothetical protein
MDLGEPSMIVKIEDIPWNGTQSQPGIKHSQKRKKKRVR